MTLFNYSNGDLKILINELEIEDLTSEQSGQNVYDHIVKNYSEFVERKLPKAIEDVFYGEGRTRHKGEGMIQYISRKKILFRKLRKASITVPDEMLGYLMLRDANLSERARDVIETWTLGDYDLETIEKYLKKLERPVPGNHGTHITGLAGLVEESGSNVASTSKLNTSERVSHQSRLKFLD